MEAPLLESKAPGKQEISTTSDSPLSSAFHKADTSVGAADRYHKCAALVDLVIILVHIYLIVGNCSLIKLHVLKNRLRVLYLSKS